MAEFAEVSRQWARMCKTMDTLYGDKCCDVCSLGGCGAVYEQDGTEDYAEIERKVMAWAKENPEPVYPTFAKYLEQFGITIHRDGTLQADFFKANEPMSADIAHKLGIEPKGES